MTEDQNKPLLSLRDVGVYYKRRRGLTHLGRFWALRNVSLDLYRGETLGVIGGNGAGKSTLMKVMSGIIKPDVGQLESRGNRSMLLSLPLRFLPRLSGRDNIVFGALLLGDTRRSIQAKLGEIIAFSELEEFIDEPLESYSTGMKARLGFSVALHTDSDIIVVDEVLGVGDAAFRRKSEAAMRDRVNSNKTVVLASHSEAAIRQMCQRAIWMRDGQVAMIGNTLEVLRSYGEHDLPSTKRGDTTNRGQRQQTFQASLR